MRFSLLRLLLFDRRGNLVAAALVLPLFLFVLFGGFVGAVAWNAKQVLTEAAREGARLVAVGRPENEVKDRVAAIVNAHLLGSKSVPSKGITPLYDLWGPLTKSTGKLYVSGIEVRGADGSVQSTLQRLVGRNVGLFGSIKDQGPQDDLQINSDLKLQVNSHCANVWSDPWTPPGGGKVERIHIKGKSERNYDYGYVYGWNGSSWVELAKRCSPGYNLEYDEWIDVSNQNITQIKTRLTTDGSVLYNPTYVDVPEVKVYLSEWYFSATHVEEYQEKVLITDVLTFDKDKDVVIRIPDTSKVSVEVRYHVPVFFPIAKLAQAFPRVNSAVPSSRAYGGPEILVRSKVEMYREPI